MPNEFRKKPVVINAMLWDGTNAGEILDFMEWRNCEVDHITGLSIKTLEGTMYANVGDWIIRGVQGEFYPCKPDIFEATYEAAVSASPSDAERPDLPTMQPPPLPPEDGETWRQVLTIFKDNGETAPSWRLRDRLVGILVWAQYGHAVSKIITAPSPPAAVQEPVAVKALRRLDIATTHKCGQEPRGEMIPAVDGEFVAFDDIGSAIKDVLVERTRQIEKEGWSQNHDDKHIGGQLAVAAACYAHHASLSDHVREHSLGWPRDWPWARAWWKPTDRRRDLVKAAALIIAEIERLDRSALSTSQSDPAPQMVDRTIFTLEWISGARPPIHPAPMNGRRDFPTFEDALAFMNRLASDAQFTALTEHRTVSADRTDAFRAAIAPQQEEAK